MLKRPHQKTINEFTYFGVCSGRSNDRPFMSVSALLFGKRKSRADLRGIFREETDYFIGLPFVLMI